jgi:hypothetical protein
MFGNRVGFFIIAFILLALAYAVGGLVSNDITKATSGIIASYSMWCAGSLVIGLPVALYTTFKSDGGLRCCGSLIGLIVLIIIFALMRASGW